MISETLEQRQLLAGPDLIGVQPNEGSLINGGEILNVSPREIVFRFDDNTELDPSTLDGIRISRAGEDGVFESATATSDLGSGGQAIGRISSDRKQVVSAMGSKSILFPASRPDRRSQASRSANRIVTIEVNNNPSNPTQVQNLVSAVASDPVAGGSSGSDLGQRFLAIACWATIETGLSLTLAGANAAEATTDFGTGGAVDGPNRFADCPGPTAWELRSISNGETLLVRPIRWLLSRAIDSWSS